MKTKIGHIFTIVGGAIIALLSLSNIFNLINLSSDWFLFILGLILIIRGILK